MNVHLNVETRPGFCRFCQANCAMPVDVAGDRVAAVRGDPDNPVYGGCTCQKGRRLAVAHNHPGRRTMHQHRTANGFEPATAGRSLTSQRA